MISSSARDGATGRASAPYAPNPFFRLLAAPMFALTLGLSATVAACQGCRGPTTPNGDGWELALRHTIAHRTEHHGDEAVHKDDLALLL